ncbi:hypothetical protein HER10_EVM0003988 [Colletotrichum scovillei]|uniref:uncharacterized protein n=1 Tax=Colletotrichum scovillei TaxID=1209932 RepID=UPI0015C2D2DD|nr:uncharacterized protein HER10_EVM0003988 [Colletotrichum scovillei]KAF4784090.1 hypothetical protein HER10_EVM0003988 [Colletotrichum scovillei]
MRFSAALSVAILASAGFAAPVDTEQHPLASPSHVSKAPAVAAREEDPNLGRACFCANGSICCNTSEGLDCTQGLCGL